MLQQAGMNVEYAGMDFGAVLQRQLKKDPIAQGGWSAAVGNWQGIDWLNPAGNTNLRGDSKAAGWYKSEKMGALRSQWLAAAGVAEQQRLCREIQALAFDEIPYFRSVSINSQPRTAPASPAFSMVRLCSGMCGPHEHDRDLGSYVLSRRDGAQEVLRDHWVLLEGKTIAAVTRDRPSADEVFDRPGRFVLPGLMNMHNHCFSEAIARTHTEDGNGRRNNQSIVFTVLLPLTKRGARCCRQPSGWPSRGSAFCNC